MWVISSPMSKEITFGSLFSGIGGLDLGLERAGMKCAWQVEIDEYARKILTKHWPDIPKFTDVRTVGKHNLASVDVIAGGFPCQDVSLAGKRRGLAGERSGLWAEYFRIIGELRPRVALIENVPGLLTAGFDRVLCDLASIEYGGWGLDGKRPFGNSYVEGDILEIIGWEPIGDEYTQDQEEYASDLYGDLGEYLRQQWRMRKAS